MKKTKCLIISLIICCLAPILLWSSPSNTELESFFDEVVPGLMGEFNVAGAVVGITDSTNTVFQKGYGKADIENDISVDPDKTLFRPGSITKLFTWTAIMQLEEEGLLKLSDPIEKYIDFEIPDTYEKPIRIIDLMNHTPGFEDRLIGLMVTDQKYVKPLKQMVSEKIPRRVQPPGTSSSYSNYGTMLAGYIVQVITGLSYEQYIEKFILAPLKMNDSTMFQPPARSGKLNKGRLSTGYMVENATYVPQTFEYINGAPAGALSSTCSDMLRFLRAYINEGQGEEEDILKPETAKRMRTTSFQHDPRTNGMAHGFIEMGTDSYRVLGHGGDTIFFHSISGYIPGKNFGYFISTNTGTGAMLTFALQRLMLDEFYPVPDGKILAGKYKTNTDLKEYTGFFSMDRRSESDPTQIMGGITLIKPIVSDDGKGLFIKSIIDPNGSNYLPIDKDIFQQENGRLRLVFLRDEAGTVQSVYSNDFPVFLFSRPPWVEDPYLNSVVVAIGMLLLISVVFVPPFGLLTLIPKLRPSIKGRGVKIVRGSIWSYICLLGAQVVVVIGVGNLIFNPIGPIHAIPFYLASVSLLAMIYGLVLLWKQEKVGLLTRIYSTIFTAGQVLLVAFLGYWGFFFM